MRRSKPSADVPPAKWTTTRRLVGYLVAAACLAWVFYDVNPSRLVQSLGSMNWRWVVLAVAFDILGYCTQGVQWVLLLNPLGKIPLIKAIQAIYAGLFTNEMIPMRAGELVRIFLVSRWLSVDFASVIPSVIVGRLFDGLWLAVGIGLTALFIRLPQGLMEGVEILGLVVLVGVLLLSYVVIRGRGATVLDRQDKKKRGRALQVARSRVAETVRGISAIGATRRFYLSFAVSVLYLVSGIMAFWLGTWAYGLDLSLWGGAVAYFIVRLGTFVPNTPSNVGTFQFFTVLALSLLGIDKTEAAGFSVVIFAILTIPLWVIGLYAISRTGMKFRDIRKEIERPTKRTLL
jgi:uncharacterized protein (TIRG00374 family)